MQRPTCEEDIHVHASGKCLLTCQSTRTHNSRMRLRRKALWSGHLHVRSPMPYCPNCHKELSAMECKTTCERCTASFGPGSHWRPNSIALSPPRSSPEAQLLKVVLAVPLIFCAAGLLWLAVVAGTE